MTNSGDPDQLASLEANWSGSTLFAKLGHDVFSLRRVNIADTDANGDARKWSLCPSRLLKQPLQKYILNYRPPKFLPSMQC